MGDKVDRGCLVIHGLSGTPAVMKPLVDALMNEGFKVNTPLLPGHGTKVDDTVVIKWQEWWAVVENAYHELKRNTEKVSCIGLSLGSLLALKLAIEVEREISAVVSMGTPLVVGSHVEYLAYPLVKYSPVRWFYRYSKKDWEMSVADPEGLAFYKQHSYDRLSIHSVFELFALKKHVRRRLCDIVSPVFIIHGKGDRVAPVKNTKLLRKGLNANVVDEIILPRSRHVVTLDYDKDVANRAVIDFLNRFS